jgi:lipopolysaccharide transport system permease protein
MNAQKEWDLIIQPHRPWWDLRLGELWHYRDLITLWVRREFVALYKQTVLGPLWHVIPALVTSGVFSVIFSEVAKIPTDGVPPYLFYMAGTTIWTYFSNCLMSTSNVFSANMGIFGKVYFPRLAMPVASIISQLISFAVRFVVFLALWAYFLVMGSSIQPNIWVLLLPVQLMILAGLGLAFGTIVSALSTKYRDLQQLLGIGVQLIMYASPIIYPLTIVSGIWRWILLLNPLTPVIETFRLGFLGTSSIGPIYLLYSVGFTLVALLVSLMIFNRAESTFLDTV